MVVIDEQFIKAGNYDKAALHGKKIGLCHGCFDILHCGHVKHFAEAKMQVDFLFVSITSDTFVGKGKGRPFFNHDLRGEVLEGLRDIDAVFVNNFPTAVALINFLQPDLYIKGPDYLDSKDCNLNAEINAIRNYGGEVYFTSGVKYSSTKLFEALYSQL